MGARCVHVVYPHRALANNCHASFYDKEGPESVDWKKGKPVRVVSPHISETKTLNGEAVACPSQDPPPQSRMN